MVFCKKALWVLYFLFHARERGVVGEGPVGGVVLGGGVIYACTFVVGITRIGSQSH